MGSTAEMLEAGRALFNGGKYWEAHETWEQAWRVEQGAVRLLLQGLIQVAAGCHKVMEQQPRGAVTLLGRGLEKLTQPDAEAGGLALRDFRSAVERLLTDVRRWDAGQCERPALTLALK